MKKKAPKAVPYNGRDYNIIKIIQGATKAGVQTDQKKEASKKLARKKVKVEDE